MLEVFSPAKQLLRQIKGSRDINNKRWKAILKKQSPEKVLDMLLRNVGQRLKNDNFEIIQAEMVVEQDEQFTTSFRGETTFGEVPGLIAITGVFGVRGSRVRLFPRFISRPFWQLAQLPIS